MGNFHCVPNGCGRVVYREYLPSQVRYRARGENWQYVDGDSYELIEDDWNGGRDPNKSYSLKYMTHGAIYYSSKPAQVVLPISDVRVVVGGQIINGYYVADGRGISTEVFDATSQWKGWLYVTRGRPYEFLEFVPSDGSTENPYCTLTITKGNREIFKKTFEECPQVEKLPCRLSDEVKEIKIDKLPWLERIEVVPYFYGHFGLNVYQSKIPDECLNIYKNLTTTVIPQFANFPTPSNASPATYGFVAQICSTPGCPPPEYNVICDCDCEKCPDNTCPVECDGVVCCYDPQGKSIKSIPIENYCGGTP